MMAGPAMTKCFEAAGSILEAGTSDPLLKVEYSWNLDGAGFSLDPPTHEEWGKTFVGLLRDSIRPPEIVSHEGFAGRLCRHRYGPEAGPAMEGFYVPSPVGDEGVPEGAQANELLPEPGDAWLRLNDAIWPTVGDAQVYRHMAEYCQAQVARNTALLDEFGTAMFADHIPAWGMVHMETLVGGLSLGNDFGRAQASAAEGAAALLEGNEEGADAAWAEALRRLDLARETAGPEQRWIDSVARRRKAVSTFMSQMRRAAPQLRKQAKRLAEIRERAAELRAALAASLQGENGQQAISLENLEGARIAFPGGVSGAAMLPRLLRDAGAICEDARGQALSEVVKDADLICFPSRPSALRAGEAELLVEYVEGGGAICTSGGAPFFLCGNNVDLTSIAAWLGAGKYGNYGGPVTAAGDTTLTAGLRIDKSMTPQGSGSACLVSPLHGLPVLVAKSNAGIVCAMVCQHGKGRSAFVWSLSIDDEAPGARKDFLLRILAWLCG